MYQKHHDGAPLGGPGEGGANNGAGGGRLLSCVVTFERTCRMGVLCMYSLYFWLPYTCLELSAGWVCDFLAYLSIALLHPR